MSSYNPATAPLIEEDEEDQPFQRSVPSSTGRKRMGRSPPPRPLTSFGDFSVSTRSATGVGFARATKKLISAAMNDEYKDLADKMQFKCEDGILFVFKGVQVFKYWTDYPKSLAIIIPVPEGQFAEEFKSQFGTRVFKLFLEDIKSLPFNFPIVAASKVGDNFPAGHVPVKLRLSPGMLDKFRTRDNAQVFKTDAVWDLYVLPSVYHASQDIPVPGFSFRLQRAEERAPR